MSERGPIEWHGHTIEWRTVYRTNKRVLFIDGRGVGDAYKAEPSDGVLRVRWWYLNQVDRAELEGLVTSPELAEALLLEWLEQKSEQEANG